MYNGVDYRSILIKEYRDTYDETTLTSVATFSLTGEEQVGLDDIPRWLIDDLGAMYKDSHFSGLAGHSLKDIRSLDEIGAGASGQEIILSLVTSIGYDAAKSLALKLSNRLRERYARKSDVPVSLNDDLERVKATIQSYFNFDGQLRVVEVLECVVLEDKNGNRYRAERLMDNLHNLRIEKLERPRS
jgi:hypothetical protein